jgi:heptosyltransferase-1
MQESTPSQLDRILIVRLSAMGDVIHSMPAVAALRQALPHATIGWVIEERWSELLCTLWYPRHGALSGQKPLVDRVHCVRTRLWRKKPHHPSTWEDIAVSLSDIRGGRYQIAIDLQGAVRSAVLASWSQAPTVVGYAQPRESAASLFYTRQVQARGAHVIDQGVSLVSAVARQELVPAQVPFPQDLVAEEWCDRQLSENTGRKFVVINPGAGWGAKQWPVENYAAVARTLAQEGISVFVNHGPGEEPLARFVETESKGAARPLQCSIAELVALLRRAALVIGGDTGPVHLAAALGIPVVAVFGPTDPARTGPFGTRSIVLRSAQSMTSHKRRRDPEEGLLNITAEAVLDAAHTLLQAGAQ